MFRKINERYAKYKILAEKNGLILAKDTDAKDFYLFGSEKDFECLCFPANQCGTHEEVLAELERWKNEINFNNPDMLNAENAFISVLQEQKLL